MVQSKIELDNSRAYTEFARLRFHVASVPRGGAGTHCKSLKFLGPCCIWMRHEKGALWQDAIT